jgi:hypothetical protein
MVIHNYLHQDPKYHPNYINKYYRIHEYTQHSIHDINCDNIETTTTTRIIVIKIPVTSRIVIIINSNNSEIVGVVVVVVVVMEEEAVKGRDMADKVEHKPDDENEYFELLRCVYIHT